MGPFFLFLKLIINQISMKKIITFLLLLCAVQLNAQIRISQVYGGGGNASATYNQDFVELFNAGTTPVDISGWSVQYASYNGSAWAVNAIPAGTTPIAAGKYFLVGLAVGGANGSALPTVDATGTSNMSGSQGKVALVNSTTALSGTTACSDASVVDVLGYGTINTTCGEGTIASNSGIGNTKAFFRKTNGCTETNNNVADFEILDVAPRNSASPANPCSGGPTPSITAAPNVNGLTAALGNASNVGTYTLIATDLTPATGNITVTPGTHVELSTSIGGPFSNSAFVVPYTGGAVTTALYVRIAASASSGSFAGSVTHAGGGAANAILTVTGIVSINYYNTKANLGLNNLGTWSSTLDGSGASPANFTDAFQYFNIVSAANASYSGIIDIQPSTSRLVIGDGTAPMSFTILPGADSVTSATRVDVLNNATLVMQNYRRPFLNNLATGSTVDFAQNGTSSSDTVRIPALSFFNLKLTGGLKYFSSGTTTTRGNITWDGVVSTNGSSPSFSTINALGNVIFTNNSAFEPSPSGDAARLTLKMNSTAASSTLSLPNTNLIVFRLQRDSVSAHSILLNGSNATLTLGNATSGGLQLTPANTSFSIADANLNIIGGGYVTTSANGKLFAEGANININKTNGTSNAGVLRFETDSYLNNFTIDLGAGVTADSVSIANDITINGVANFTNGKVNMASGQTFMMAAGSSISGGSSTSFLRGSMSKNGNTAFSFPVGRENKYAPVALANISTASNFTVEYFNTAHAVSTIDPATATAFPAYNLSTVEHWTINRAPAATADITFNYTDASSNIFSPSAIRIAHFDGTDWDDIGGIPAGGNTNSNGSITVTGVSQFSPFTFGAATGGVLPVSISNFTVQKNGQTATIRFTTEQEVNTSAFVIEKSLDQRIWMTIETIAAAGNSQSRLQYSVTDFAPVKGINFYRIKTLETDNGFSYSATKSALFGSATLVMITPNPTTSLATIFIDKDANSRSQIVITDMNGRVVENILTTENIYTIQTQKYGKGTYAVKVTTGQQTHVSKLLVQ